MNPELVFPKLERTGYAVTSPPTPVYNCIAWAAGDTERWWWPDRMGSYHWPPGVVRDESIEAFVSAFATLGYSLCDDAGTEPGIQKIAVYAKGGLPKHAARQLPDGRWTSKLGRSLDITHDSLASLEGEAYGRVVCILARRVRQQP